MKSTRLFIFIGVLSVLLTIGVALFLVMGNTNKTPTTEAERISESSDGDGKIALVIVPVVLVIVGLSLLPFLRMIFPPAIKNGVKAKATVLKVWDTGVSVNNNPRVGLLLEIQPEGKEPFQAEARKIVSRLQVALVQPGVKADVIYDPLNLKRVQVQSFVMEPVATEKKEPVITRKDNLEARLSDLKNLRQKDLITEDEYQRTKAEILKEL